MILQDEVFRVVPVVGNLTGVMPAHHVHWLRAATDGIVSGGAALTAFLRLGNEAIHLATINVSCGVAGSMRATAIGIIRVVVGLDALPRAWIRHTNRRDTVFHGNAIGAWICAEVFIKRAVFLHDDDHMLDLGGNGVGCRGMLR